MFKQLNRGEHRSSATNAGVPRNNRSLAARQRRVLRSSVQRDCQPTAKETSKSSLYRNCVVLKLEPPPSGSWALRYWAGVVPREERYRERCKQHQMYQAQLECAHSCAPDSEVRVSFRTLDRDIPQEEDIAAIEPSTTGSKEKTGR